MNTCKLTTTTAALIGLENFLWMLFETLQLRINFLFCLQAPLPPIKLFTEGLNNTIRNFKDFHELV